MPSIRGRCGKRPSDAAKIHFVLTSCPHAPISARRRGSATWRARSNVSPSGAATRRRMQKLADDARAGVYLIGGELSWCLSPSARNSTIRCFRPPRRVRLAAVRESVFLGLMEGAPRFGLGLDPQADRAAESAQRSESRRSAHHRGPRDGRRRSCAAAGRSQGGARLACAAPFLSQLRRADASRSRPAGAAIARPAASSTFRAPIRS